LHQFFMKVKNKTKNIRKEFAFKPKTFCPNCDGETTITGGHFAPPMDGNEGFFTCDKKVEIFIPTTREEKNK